MSDESKVKTHVQLRVELPDADVAQLQLLSEHLQAAAERQLGVRVNPEAKTAAVYVIAHAVRRMQEIGVEAYVRELGQLQ